MSFLFSATVLRRAIGLVILSLIIGGLLAQDHQLIAQDSSKSQPASAEYVCPPCGCNSCGEVFDIPGKCPDCGMTLVEKEKILNVAVVIWQDVELLDFSGPGEVFAAARSDDGRSFRVFTVSKTKQSVVSQGFLSVNPTYSIEDCPHADIIVLPGGGTSHVTGDKEFMDWVKRSVDESKIALSVCTGAFVLAEHGFLNDLDATTWHGAIDDLRKKYPQTRVHSDRRFIDNGRIITSAGVSAGIDSSLHVVARLFGKESAEKTARYMEYHWRFADEETADPKTTDLSDHSDQSNER